MKSGKKKKVDLSSKAPFALNQLVSSPCQARNEKGAHHHSIYLATPGGYSQLNKATEANET